MIKVLHRALAFSVRFVAGVHHFGFAGAVKVFCLYRWRHDDDLETVPLRTLSRPFHFRVKSDRGVLCMFYTEGYRVADSFGSRATVIIDAGANIGDSTMRLRRFHPQAQIVAIEADGDNHAVLARNFAGDPQVRCLHRALWSESGEVRIRKTWANVASRVGDNDQGVPVAAVTIPSLMAELGLDHIDILKLDIEGAESAVFKTTDLSWVHQVRCIIFECCDADDPGTTQSIMTALTDSGWRFQCHVVGENLILIHHDTPWHVVADLWMDQRANLLPHITAKMAAVGLKRLD